MATSDPHRDFVCGNPYIVFAATMRGEIDLGMSETEQLVPRPS